LCCGSHFSSKFFASLAGFFFAFLFFFQGYFYLFSRGRTQPAASFFFAFFLRLGLYLQCHSASGAGSAGDLACDHGIDFGFGHSGHSCCDSAIGGYGYGGFRGAHSASD
jgi:hypothetical protein